MRRFPIPVPDELSSSRRQIGAPATQHFHGSAIISYTRPTSDSMFQYGSLAGPSTDKTPCLIFPRYPHPACCGTYEPTPHDSCACPSHSSACPSRLPRTLSSGLNFISMARIQRRLEWTLASGQRLLPHRLIRAALRRTRCRRQVCHIEGWTISTTIMISQLSLTNAKYLRGRKWNWTWLSPRTTGMARKMKLPPMISCVHPFTLADQPLAQRSVTSSHPSRSAWYRKVRSVGV